jgi:hypothetical protein
MIKMDKSYVRSLCEDLATEPSPTKRANAATTLKGLLAEEKKKESTPAGSAMLRIASEIFHFLEELSVHQRPVPATDHARSSRVTKSLSSQAHFAD